MSTKLFLEPLDVTLFRDGRAYNAGEDHAAASIFPPPPSVIQGVLRTSYLVQNGVGLADYAGGNNEANQAIGRPGDESVPFTVKGPFMARQNGGGCELLFPWPADLIVTRGDEPACVPASPTKRFGDTPKCSLPEGLLPVACPDDLEGDTRFALSCSGLADYLLRGALGAQHTIQKNAFLKADTRVGLGLRPGVKTAEEGLLYSVSFNSLCSGCGLAIEIERLQLDAAGMVKIGGEGRAAVYTTADWASPVEPTGIRDHIRDTGRFSLYLATPTLFETRDSGVWSWKTDDWTAAGLPASARLKGFACAGYSDYGGWDLVSRWPRPMKRCVNAGSVYFFDCESGISDQQVKSLFDQRWFQAMPGRYKNVGVGITLIGEWDYV